MNNKGKISLSKKILWIGVFLMVMGTGPLISSLIGAHLGLGNDPNPNPVYFGIMAMLTFWPSVILIILGIFVKIKEDKVK